MEPIKIEVEIKLPDLTQVAEAIIAFCQLCMKPIEAVAPMLAVKQAETEESAPIKPVAPPKAAKAVEVITEPDKVEAKPEVKAKALTIADVRAVFGPLTVAGKNAEIKTIITSLGASKLSEIDPADYEEAIRLAGGIK